MVYLSFFIKVLLKCRCLCLFCLSIEDLEIMIGSGIIFSMWLIYFCRFWFDNNFVELV